MDSIVESLHNVAVDAQEKKFVTREISTQNQQESIEKTIHDLPIEIIEEILLRLPSVHFIGPQSRSMHLVYAHKANFKSMTTAALVCKQWAYIIQSVLFRTVSFHLAKNIHVINQSKKESRRLAGYVRELTILDGYVPKKSLIPIIFPNLVFLGLAIADPMYIQMMDLLTPACTNIRVNDIVANPFTFPILVEKLISIAPKLHPSFKVGLDLNAVVVAPPIHFGFKRLIEKIPRNIDPETLGWWAGVIDGYVLKLIHVPEIHCLIHPKSSLTEARMRLETGRVVEFQGWPAMFDMGSFQAWEIFSKNLFLNVNLKSLSLSEPMPFVIPRNQDREEIENVEAFFIAPCPKTMPLLPVLPPQVIIQDDVPDTPFQIPNSFLLQVGNLNSLTSLHLSSQENVDDYVLYQLGLRLNTLKELHISRCDLITLKGIQLLLFSHDQLDDLLFPQEINLSNLLHLDVAGTIVDNDLFPLIVYYNNMGGKLINLDFTETRITVKGLVDYAKQKNDVLVKLDCNDMLRQMEDFQAAYLIHWCSHFQLDIDCGIMQNWTMEPPAEGHVHGPNCGHVHQSV